MERGIVKKTLNWMRVSRNAIEEAHGNPDCIMKSIPMDVLETLIRNDLFIVYKPVDNPVT